jgi:MYXO-CTERM domain-containing protein
MADVDGDGVPELALAGNASRMLVYEGIQPARERGEDAEILLSMNPGSRGPLTTVSNPLDAPLLNTFAHPSFHDLDQDGVPDFVTGGAGLLLATNLAGGWQNDPFTHQIGAWSSRVGTNPGLWQMLPGFPQAIEDYLFFNNPSSADVDGDGYPEVLLGSGGYYLHAWDACGKEAEGFPKFLGGWIITSVGAGDIDGDGLLEVVAATRSGYLFAFDTMGPADGSVGWPEFRHDNHNTGNYETPLAFGSRVTADAPLDCEIPAGPDAGVGDAAMDAPMGDDAGPGVDTGMGPGVSGGTNCGCRTAGEGPSGGMPLLLSVFALGVLMRRRRRG